MRPLLARPWVYLHNVTDLKHQPSWLSAEQQQYSERLFQAGVKGFPVLVAETLDRMKKGSPQVAFAGRSNVGKSTLLNMLLHSQGDPLLATVRRGGQILGEHKKLSSPLVAPVSHKPGRTRHLFRFEIGGRLTFVDLPGYGFAAVKEQTKEGWTELVDRYLEGADQLTRVISLIDAKVGVKETDEELWRLLQERKHSVMVVLTKVDQVPPEVLNRTMGHVVALLERLNENYLWPYVHAVSGLYGHGILELRASLSAVAADHAGGITKLPSVKRFIPTPAPAKMTVASSSGPRQRT